MRVEDITIEVRNENLVRQGQIDLRLITDMKLIKRFNNVGSWTFSLPAENEEAKLLAKPGYGITVEATLPPIGHMETDGFGNKTWVIDDPAPRKTLMSGPMINSSQKASRSDPLGTLTFTGVDDNVHVADPLAWPEPGNDDVENQTLSHDVRSGPVESVMKAYVNANIGDDALPSRKNIVNMVVAPDLLRGNIVTGRARFPVLGKLLSDLGSEGAGNMGFEILQNDVELIFDVYQPVDRSRSIRMDLANDTLDEINNSISAPTATRAIGAGQGEGEDRRFILTTDAEALEAETIWRRKIERFYDRRDTDEDGEIEQTGVDIITSEGRTIVSLSVIPSDEDTMAFAVDWYVGDIVGVTVGEEELASVVTEAIISIGNEGLRVAATVGDPAGFDYESKMIAAQKNQEVRLAFLEKNAESPTGILPLNRIPLLPASQINSGVLSVARLPMYLRTQLRGTTAERDAYWGTPVTDPQRVALANFKPRWFNTDLGWEEGYYATTGLTGLTARGLVAGVSSSWYPSGQDGPEVTMEPTVSTGVSNGTNLQNWTGNVWRKGGDAAFTFNGTYQALVWIPGYYDIWFWTTQQAGGGTADYWLRHVNAANNAVPRQAGGLAYTLVSNMWTHVHGELNHELMKAGERFDAVCVTGTLAVHQGDATTVRGQMGAKWRGPALASY